MAATARLGGALQIDIPNYASWQLLWQVDATETSRVTASSTSTDYDLISGESFANHEILVAWIDNNVNREGKFMFIDRERFATVFTTTDGGGGWVDWSDGGLDRPQIL